MIGLDNLRWSRRRLKVGTEDDEVNCFGRFGPGAVAIGSKIYLYGGNTVFGFINNSDNRDDQYDGDWIDELWAFDFSGIAFPLMPSIVLAT